MIISGCDYLRALIFFATAHYFSPLLNPLPDLGNLQDGDLTHEIDFKQVYAAILENWLDNDSKAILGSSYSKLGFI